MLQGRCKVNGRILCYVERKSKHNLGSARSSRDKDKRQSARRFTFMHRRDQHCSFNNQMNNRYAKERSQANKNLWPYFEVREISLCCVSRYGSAVSKKRTNNPTTLKQSIGLILVYDDLLSFLVVA